MYQKKEEKEKNEMEQEEEGKKRNGRRGGEEGGKNEEAVEKKILGEEGRVKRTSGILTPVSPPPPSLLVSGLELSEILRYLLNMPVSDQEGVVCHASSPSRTRYWKLPVV